MQDISLEYLGKYAGDDPRRVNRPPWRGIGNGSEQTPLESRAGVDLGQSLVIYAKFHAFPTGPCPWR